MSLSTQDYADLSGQAYFPPPLDASGQFKFQTINGIQYKPLEYMRDPGTGCRGTIYQRVDTGEIVVAHRGTDLKNIRDIATDVAMVLAGVNPQLADAQELTRHALAYAKQYLENHPGRSVPPVTITGHSMGGTLAQITAHEFGLRAETFNPYGAVSLHYGLRVGRDDNIVNHVMAADTVSAASPQPGHVLVYASEKEVQTLHQLGYTNASGRERMEEALSPMGTRIARPAGAAMVNLDARGISNFTNVDHQEHRHPSILGDFQARQRATQNAALFEQYRADVLNIRSGLSLPGDALHAADRTLTRAEDAFLQNALHLSNTANQWLDDVGLGPPRMHTHARQPLPPTPAATPPAATWDAAQFAQRPADPRNPEHRSHAMYQSVRGQLVALYDTQSIELSPTQLDNCTAAVMADAREARMYSVTGMVFTEPGGQINISRIGIFEGNPRDPASNINVTNMTQALNTPAERSFQQFEQNTQTMMQQQQQQQQQWEQQRVAELQQSRSLSM